jgi:hypothetical protein
MRLNHIILFSLSLALLGCTPDKPKTNTTSLNLKQLMEWVIDSNADVIWDSVKFITTNEGTKEIFPQTDQEWEAIRNSSATLIEAGNLLMLEGRAKDNGEWVKYAQRLSNTAEVAMKAAQEKNKETLFDAGGNIYNACKACHDKYAQLDK